MVMDKDAETLDKLKAYDETYIKKLKKSLAWYILKTFLIANLISGAIMAVVWFGFLGGVVVPASRDNIGAAFIGVFGTYYFIMPTIPSVVFIIWLVKCIKEVVKTTKEIKEIRSGAKSNEMKDENNPSPEVPADSSFKPYKPF